MKKITSLFKKSEERPNNPEEKINISENTLFTISKEKLSKGKLAISAGTGAIIIGLVLLFSQSTGYAVYYGDEILGFVESPEVVTENIVDINESISDNTNVRAIVKEEGFEFEKGCRLFYEKDGTDEIAQAAAEKCDLDVSVYDIYIDGQLVGQDSSLENVENAIARIKDSYIKEHFDENIKEFGFSEKLEIRITKAAETNSMTADEVQAALGNLTVAATSYVTELSEIPYEIVYENTDAREIGDSTVKIAGVNGINETVKIVEKVGGIEVASTAVSSRVVSEKVDQVVLIGTKGLVVADSGMANPSRGTLSSYMGQRWGRQHKGIDITGDTNDPITAALQGTVIETGDKGNGYGKMVKIDHGNGLVTLYAHLNEIYVKEGDTVSIGSVIGGMGNTGRSTGTHLHFEVILNGANVNPLDYVNY